MPSGIGKLEHSGVAVSLLLGFPFLLIFLAVMFAYSWQPSLIAVGCLSLIAVAKGDELSFWRSGQKCPRKPGYLRDELFFSDAVGYEKKFVSDPFSWIPRPKYWRNSGSRASIARAASGAWWRGRASAWSESLSL